MSIADQLKTDTATAMKAGERERAQALRYLLSELQKAAKEGGDDEVAVLRRERKRRADSAEQYREGGREDLAASEESEAELIAAYLPAELDDAELDALVAEAIEQSGAQSPADVGKVMGALMPRVDGRAEGKRVSAKVRDALAGS